MIVEIHIHRNEPYTPSNNHNMKKNHQMLNALRQHWPEYFMEAFGLGIFMISAGVFATLLS